MEPSTDKPRAIYTCDFSDAEWEVCQPYGIRLEVVKLSETKKGFAPAQAPGGGAQLWLGGTVQASVT